MFRFHRPLTQMDHLPVEIVTKIVQKSDREELLALSTVNRLFRNIAQAELYKQIHLQAATVHEISNDPHISGFAQTIEKRPEIASLCQTLLCHFIPYYAPTVDVFLSMFPPLSQLHHFSNLRNLRLRRFIISAESRSVICSLPHLRWVEFVRCEMEDCHLDPDEPFPSRQLEMTITNPLSNAGWNTIALAGLRGLTLSTTCCAEPILFSLMSQGQVHSLDTLNVEANRLDNIVSFLESSPQLRRISIHGPVADPLHPIFSLPKDAIPMLQDFTGPSEYCATFINGRPVKSVKITSKSALTSIPTDVLLSLRTSSVAITMLELGLNVLAADLPHIPHTLHFLNMMMPIPEEKLSEWAVNALFNMQHLQVLECDMQVSLTMPTVLVLAEKCPSLREIFVHMGKVVAQV